MTNTRKPRLEVFTDLASFRASLAESGRRIAETYRAEKTLPGCAALAVKFDAYADRCEQAAKGSKP